MMPLGKTWTLLGAALSSSALLLCMAEPNHTTGTTTITVIPSHGESQSLCAATPILTNHTSSPTSLKLLIANDFSYRGKATLHPGFFHLAAALMAMDHFNERNPIVVPELAQLRDCSYTMDYDQLQVFDTQTDQTNAMASLLQQPSSLFQSQLPHAILGPFNEIPSRELAVIASGFHIPLITHRGIDHNLLHQQSFVSQVNPDLYSNMQVLGQYLLHWNRTNFIAVLYASNVDSAVQRVETFRGVAYTLNMTHVQTFGYASPGEITPGAPDRTPRHALQQLKASGYRTIIWISRNFHVDGAEISAAAHEFELDVGNHLWIMAAGIELSLEPDAEEIVNSLPTTQFIWGSVYLEPVDPVLYDEVVNETNSFLTAWQSQNASFVKRLAALNPFPVSRYQEQWDEILEEIRANPAAQGLADSFVTPSPIFPPDNLFISVPNAYSTFLYDAVIATGMGACLAEKNKTGDNHTTTPFLTGEQLQAGIRAVDFQGASGRVLFGNAKDTPGSRVGSTVSYAVFNIMPEGLDG
jgi:Receptor family ligand binding region